MLSHFLIIGAFVLESWPEQDLSNIDWLINYVSDPLDIAGDGHVHQPLHFRKDPNQVPEWMTSINDKIKKSDAMVIVTPEYNCGLPPALSGIMDQFPPASYRHKPCGIVCYSMGMNAFTIIIREAALL